MTDLEPMDTLGQFFAKEFQDLQKTAEMRSYAAGQLIFEQGDPGDGFFHVESGEVEISVRLGDDDRRVFARVGPGEIFGEMAVLDDGPRSAAALAARDTKAYFIGREELFRILQANPEAMIRLLRFFSRRVRNTNQQYIEEMLQAEKLAVIGRFARTIVHDFKNPLNIIGISAELAASPRASETTRGQSLVRIEAQVKRLTGMLNELLEFSRGPSQHLMLVSQPYRAWLDPRIAELRAELAERRIDLHMPEPAPDAPVRMDPQRLGHLFYNLVNNAADELKKTGGSITLTFETGASEVTTHVEDTGPGIAPEIAEKLFEPFATHGKAHGTGLGLSICKRILEDHGGRIWATSEPGRGARFSFTLRHG
jgi:signal transduction histidine kinase